LVWLLKLIYLVLELFLFFALFLDLSLVLVILFMEYGIVLLDVRLILISSWPSTLTHSLRLITIMHRCGSSRLTCFRFEHIDPWYTSSRVMIVDILTIIWGWTIQMNNGFLRLNIFKITLVQITLWILKRNSLGESSFLVCTQELIGLIGYVVCALS